MLGCMVLGGNCFSLSVNIKEVPDISSLKKAIKNEKENDFHNIDYYRLSLWKVEIPAGDRRLELLNNPELNIASISELLGAEFLNPILKIGRYFPDTYEPPEEHVHIIVQSPSPATTVSPVYIPSDKAKIEIKNKVIKTFPHIDPSSIDQLVDALALIWHVNVDSDSPGQQNDPYVELKKEPSFFKTSLPCGITERTHTTVDLCLPSYESGTMNYHNPFYDDPQFKKTVSLVQEKIEKNVGDIIVLAGVSGGGKTSTTFGVAMQRWSIYIDFNPSKGIYGDHVGKELNVTETKKPKFEHEQYDQQNYVFQLLDKVILSRGLLLIKMLIEKNISTPKEWLFAQLQMNEKDSNKIRAKLARENYDILIVTELISSINDCLNVKSLTLIFDEAQVLCKSDYGEYKGNSVPNKKWNLLQAYIEHLTHIPVTCLLAGTYMHMSSGISLVTSVGKVQGLHDHIVLKLPFLLRDDVLRNLDAVIDLTDVSPKILNFLGCLLRGRPRNCASFVQLLTSKRISVDRTKDQKDQEILKLIIKWYKKICSDMATYLEDACKYFGANNFNTETAILDVLRLRVFYNHKFDAAIELLQHSIIPCKSPECITLGPDDITPAKIEINTSLESYLVSGIELFLKRTRSKTLIEVFVDNIIRLNNISSIGNEFDAAFITAIIQKLRHNVVDELNLWKNGQQFDLPSWITPTMKFATTSNISGAVSIAKYVDDETYRYFAIQPDIYSGSDVVVSLVDDEQNVILLSASCTVSGSPIERAKVKKQLIKSCMKFQYMECPKKPYKKIPRLQTFLNVNNDLEEEENDLEEDCRPAKPTHQPTTNPKERVNLNKSLPRKIFVAGQVLNFDDVDYDLDYTKNIKNYRISKVSVRAKNHEKIKISTKDRKHIYVSVELPHRRSKRSELFRFNEYGDLVIIVDDRNMKAVFGEPIERLVKSLRQRWENQENSMDLTE